MSIRPEVTRNSERDKGPSQNKSQESCVGAALRRKAQPGVQCAGSTSFCRGSRSCRAVDRKACRNRVLPILPYV
eukprot:4586345-Karenia_brevis.AAC.1